MIIRSQMFKPTYPPSHLLYPIRRIRSDNLCTIKPFWSKLNPEECIYLEDTLNTRHIFHKSVKILDLVQLLLPQTSIPTPSLPRGPLELFCASSRLSGNFSGKDEDTERLIDEGLWCDLDNLKRREYVEEYLISEIPGYYKKVLEFCLCSTMQDRLILHLRGKIHKLIFKKLQIPGLSVSPNLKYSVTPFHSAVELRRFLSPPGSVLSRNELYTLHNDVFVIPSTVYEDVTTSITKINMNLVTSGAKEVSRSTFKHIRKIARFLNKTDISTIFAALNSLVELKKVEGALKSSAICRTSQTKKYS